MKTKLLLIFVLTVVLFLSGCGKQYKPIFITVQVPSGEYLTYETRGNIEIWDNNTIGFYDYKNYKLVVVRTTSLGTITIEPDMSYTEPSNPAPIKRRKNLEE